MVAIVVAVGVTRSWKASLIGAGGGLVVLAVLIAVLGHGAPGRAAQAGASRGRGAPPDVRVAVAAQGDPARLARRLGGRHRRRGGRGGRGERIRLDRLRPVVQGRLPGGCRGRRDRGRLRRGRRGDRIGCAGRGGVGADHRRHRARDIPASSRASRAGRSSCSSARCSRRSARSGPARGSASSGRATSSRWCGWRFSTARGAAWSATAREPGARAMMRGAGGALAFWSTSSSVTTGPNGRLRARERGVGLVRRGRGPAGAGGDRLAALPKGADVEVDAIVAL